MVRRHSIGTDGREAPLIVVVVMGAASSTAADVADLCRCQMIGGEYSGYGSE